MLQNRNLARTTHHPWIIILPTLLSTAFALIWFFPSQERLIGWGDDPYFNLWTLEYIWKQLSTLGITHVFSAQFWNAPIFYPTPNTLAFSENQIVLGLLSWPIRLLSGNGVFTLNLFAALMSLAAFFFCWQWLNFCGVKKYAAWGGLLFQTCGWAQDHSAHYQNICIFLFPLALCSWKYFREQPNLLRTAACGFCFGTAAGWNIYFQIFLNCIFGVLFLHAFIRNKSLRSWLIFLLLIFFAFELPFAFKYWEVEKLLGSLKVPSGEYTQNSATLQSLFSHANHSSLFQRLFAFYPRYNLSIEKVGFLGLGWVALWALSWKDKKGRVFALIALLAFWVSLGPQFGLMNLFKVIPGFHGLRALGRVQILVAFFSLTAILVFLENQKKRWPHLLFIFLILELVPGEGSKTVMIPKSYFGELTSLEKKLEIYPKNEAWLVTPDLTSLFQLSLVRTGIPTFEGYSGRIPLNAHLLQIIKTSSEGSAPLKTQLIFSGARHLISLEESTSDFLRTQSFLKWEGCFPHHTTVACIFSPQWQHQDWVRLQQPRLHLDLDTEWAYLSQDKGHLAILKAKRKGILDYESVGRCHQLARISHGSMISFTTPVPLLGHGFTQVEFQEGEKIFEAKSKQWIFSLPATFRPQKNYQIICN